MARVRINRNDPRRGAGPFVRLVTGNAELVTPNGLVWNEGHMGRIFSEETTNPQAYARGDDRYQGNRSDMVAIGGNSTVNARAPLARVKPGNTSGE